MKHKYILIIEFVYGKKGDDTIETLKDFYNDLSDLIDVLVAHPFTVLLVVGFILLFSAFTFMLTRHNYTRIINLIDQGEAEAIEKRVEEWGEMIVNNVQQKCLERKLSLTIYVFIFSLLSLLLIAFSVYKLNMIKTLILSLIHLTLLMIIYLIIKGIFKKKKNKKKVINTSDKD